MRKKLLLMALALIMCLSLMPCAFAAEAKFTDVPADAWYLDELEYAVANGYISGVGDNRFAPDGNITRGQFVTILGRMLNVSTSSGAAKFVDVAESSYYAPYVAWAAANGYVNGTSSTTFAPDANITFEQMGVILANYISKSGVVLSGCTASPAYKDAASISSYAVSSMEQMRQYGLISPDEAGNVNPQKAVSRAYGTVSLVRLAKAMGLGDASVTTSKVDYESLINSNNEYEVAALKVAIQVHDKLWASGEITSSMSQKEKAGAYFDWLRANCVYDLRTANCHTAYGALVDGKAVCDGYTLAYNLLLKLEGIDCSAVNNSEHMWTTATIDGVLYHMDATNGYFCVLPEHVPYVIDTESGLWGSFPGDDDLDWSESWDTAFSEWIDILDGYYRGGAGFDGWEEWDW